jgi:hypothetical protein
MTLCRWFHSDSRTLDDFLAGVSPGLMSSLGRFLELRVLCICADIVFLGLPVARSGHRVRLSEDTHAPGRGLPPTPWSLARVQFALVSPCCCRSPSGNRPQPLPRSVFASSTPGTRHRHSSISPGQCGDHRASGRGPVCPGIGRVAVAMGRPSRAHYGQRREHVQGRSSRPAGGKATVVVRGRRSGRTV